MSTATGKARVKWREEALAAQTMTQTRQRTRRYDWVTREAEDEADLTGDGVQFGFYGRDEGNLGTPAQPTIRASAPPDGPRLRVIEASDKRTRGDRAHGSNPSPAPATWPLFPFYHLRLPSLALDFPSPVPGRKWWRPRPHAPHGPDPGPARHGSMTAPTDHCDSKHPLALFGPRISVGT